MSAAKSFEEALIASIRTLDAEAQARVLALVERQIEYGATFDYQTGWQEVYAVQDRVMSAKFRQTGSVAVDTIREIRDTNDGRWRDM